VRSPANLGFGGGNNLGFAASRGDILLTVNPDVRLRRDALAALAAAFAADPELGIAGAKLLALDGHTIQHAGGILNYPLVTPWHRGFMETDCGQYDEPADAPFVTGAVLALRRAVFQQTGGFDAGFYPVYYEDVDLCFRARAAGWRVVYLPTVVGLHRGSGSLDAASETYYRFFHASRLRFVLKHSTTDELIRDFLPAEAARARTATLPAERQATAALYHEKQQALLGIAAPAPQARPGVQQELEMRTAEDTRAVEQYARTPQPDLQDAVGRVAQLHERWRIEERPFVSRLPMIGPLIAGLRSAWNSIATRWYVQGMVQQQVEFNAGVVHAVTALLQAVQALNSNAAAHGQALDILNTDVEWHDQGLRALQAELAQATQQEDAAVNASLVAPTLIAERLRLLEERLAALEKGSGQRP
jgi:GT2 family glycosyltransferase